MKRCRRGLSFKKELKRLSKKYRTLEDDLKKFEDVLAVHPSGIGKNFTVLHADAAVTVVKARLSCRALRERSLRVIYAHVRQEDMIEYIEIYYKGDKANEDRDRVILYLRDASALSAHG